MSCPHCTSSRISNRSRLTKLGYKTFFCNNCRRGFNERTGSPYNRRQVPTEIIFEVVLRRLRYKLSFRDLAEMYSVQGFYFTRETIRQWEAEYAPLLADELKSERRGKV